MKCWKIEVIGSDFRIDELSSALQFTIRIAILLMANDRIVGIDLGTTNSLVAFMQGESPVVIPGEDGLNLVPSVVALDDKDHIVVGNAARKYLIETPERAVYSIKRLMGRGVEDIRGGAEALPVPAGGRSRSRRSDCASSWARRPLRRRRFRHLFCASSSAMRSDSLARR